MIQWRSECEDNKKDIADNDDNDNRIANMDLARPERGEQEMSDTSSDIWHEADRGGPRKCDNKPGLGRKKVGIVTTFIYSLSSISN